MDVTDILPADYLKCNQSYTYDYGGSVAKVLYRKKSERFVKIQQLHIESYMYSLRHKKYNIERTLLINNDVKLF